MHSEKETNTSVTFLIFLLSILGVILFCIFAKPIIYFFLIFIHPFVLLFQPHASKHDTFTLVEKNFDVIFTIFCFVFGYYFLDSGRSKKQERLRNQNSEDIINSAEVINEKNEENISEKIHKEKQPEEEGQKKEEKMVENSKKIEMEKTEERIAPKDKKIEPKKKKSQKRRRRRRKRKKKDIVQNSKQVDQIKIEKEVVGENSAEKDITVEIENSNLEEKKAKEAVEKNLVEEKKETVVEEKKEAAIVEDIMEEKKVEEYLSQDLCVAKQNLDLIQENVEDEDESSALSVDLSQELEEEAPEAEHKIGRQEVLKNEEPPATTTPPVIINENGKQTATPKRTSSLFRTLTNYTSKIFTTTKSNSEKSKISDDEMFDLNTAKGELNNIDLNTAKGELKNSTTSANEKKSNNTRKKNNNNNNTNLNTSVDHHDCESLNLEKVNSKGRASSDESDNWVILDKDSIEDDIAQFVLTSRAARPQPAF